MREVARFDGLDGHDDEDIDRAELMVDHRTVAHIGADPQIAFETVTATRKMLLREKATGFQIEVFFLSDDDHDRERFARRRQVIVFDRLAYLLTLEDVLITKLRWLHLAGRRKDEEDIRGVLQLQHQRVDWPYVESWCDRHGTSALLSRLRQESIRE